MKLSKEEFSLNLLLVSSENYEGVISVVYTDKVFQKEIKIYDTSYISTSDGERKMDDKEKRLATQILNITNKEFKKKGFKFNQINMIYSPNESQIEISYVFGENINNIVMGMNEDLMICKKSQALCKSITKRIMRELK